MSEVDLNIVYGLVGFLLGVAYVGVILYFGRFTDLKKFRDSYMMLDDDDKEIINDYIGDIGESLDSLSKLSGTRMFRLFHNKLLYIVSHLREYKL